MNSTIEQEQNNNEISVPALIDAPITPVPDTSTIATQSTETPSLEQQPLTVATQTSEPLVTEQTNTVAPESPIITESSSEQEVMLPRNSFPKRQNSSGGMFQAFDPAQARAKLRASTIVKENSTEDFAKKRMSVPSSPQGSMNFLELRKQLKKVNSLSDNQ